MINKVNKKRIAFIFILMLLFTLLPDIVMESNALTIRYTITWKLKKKKTRRITKKVKLSETKATTTVGEYYYIYLDNANYKKVKWSSSNKKKATVKRDGELCKIKAKKKGKVIITAKYRGKKYRCKINIKKKYKTILRCYSSSYDKVKQKTLKFKKISPYGNSNEWYWHYWNVRTKEWDALETESRLWNWFYYELKHFVYPIKVRCSVGNPKILKVKFDNYDEDYNSWALNLYPKKAGKTTMTVSNTYNKQKIKYKVIVDDQIYYKCKGGKLDPIYGDYYYEDDYDDYGDDGDSDFVDDE